LVGNALSDKDRKRGGVKSNQGVKKGERKKRDLKKRRKQIDEGAVEDITPLTSFRQSSWRIAEERGGRFHRDSKYKGKKRRKVLGEVENSMALIKSACDFSWSNKGEGEEVRSALI